MIYRLYLVLFVVLMAFPISAEVIESIIAIVNNSIITKYDILKYKERLKSWAPWWTTFLGLILKLC